MTQAVLEVGALVTVDNGIDHVRSSVLHGLVEERRVVFVQDERCSPCQQELDGSHVALTSSEVECSVLDYQWGEIEINHEMNHDYNFLCRHGNRDWAISKTPCNLFSKVLFAETENSISVVTWQKFTISP